MVQQVSKHSSQYNINIYVEYELIKVVQRDSFVAENVANSGKVFLQTLVKVMIMFCIGRLVHIY